MTQALTLTLTNPEQSNDALAEFELTPQSIAEMGEKYLALQSVDTKSRTACGNARAILVSTRTGIDKRRKELNEDDQARIKRRNSAAKLLTDALAPYELHLDATIGEYDAAKKAEKEAKAAALQKEIDDRIAAAKAESEELARVAREAEEARLAAEAERLRIERETFEAEQLAARKRAEAEEAERKRVAAEAQALIDAENARKQAELDRQRAELEAAQEASRASAKREADRLAAEAKARQDTIDEANREAKSKLDEQRRQVEAEAARVEAARIAQERAEAERVAAAQAETERLAREEAERVAAEKRKAELEAARPDAEKLDAYMAALLAVPVPDMATETGLDARMAILDHLELASNATQAFIDSTKTEDGTWLTD